MVSELVPLIFIVLLWITAAIFLITDHRNESHRWAAVTLLFTGLGGIDDIIIEKLLPLLQRNLLINQAIANLLLLAANVISSLSILLFPYCVLMYSISYTEVFKLKKPAWKILFALFLLIPVILMYRYIELLHFYHLDSDQAGSQIVSCWAAPYILVANFLLIYSYFRTPDRITKEERLLTCLIVTPTTVVSLMFGYIIVAFGVLDAWKYQIWTVVVFFSAFIICGLTYGAIGIKIKFEKNRLDNTMKAISSGVLLLNHAVKNEVAKIAICIDNIKASELPPENEAFHRYLNQNLQIVSNSADHLSALVNRVHGQTQEIILNESPQNIKRIIDETLTSIAPFLQEKNIQVTQKINPSTVLICDPVHLREVLVNICKNAIEAMKPGGLLHIKAYLEKKAFILAIQDNGAGVAKENLPKVFEPFFSTKNRNGNFGLGLSYCYKVIRQHGGSLKIESRANIGTTVSLHFSRKKVLPENSLYDGMDISDV